MIKILMTNKLITFVYLYSIFYSLNKKMNCTINFDENTSVFLNQFFNTLGQITAGAVSTAILLPMYNYYTRNTQNQKKIN